MPHQHNSSPSVPSDNTVNGNGKWYFIIATGGALMLFGWLFWTVSTMEKQADKRDWRIGDLEKTIAGLQGKFDIMRTDANKNEWTITENVK